jgi:hypothetical protein
MRRISSSASPKTRATAAWSSRSIASIWFKISAHSTSIAETRSGRRGRTAPLDIGRHQI